VNKHVKESWSSLCGDTDHSAGRHIISGNIIDSLMLIESGVDLAEFLHAGLGVGHRRSGAVAWWFYVWTLPREMDPPSVGSRSVRTESVIPSIFL